MPYALDFTIDALPDLQVAAGKGSWRGRQAQTKRWHDRVAAAVLDAGRPAQPLLRARVRFERHSTTEPDVTNLCASFKAVEDGLVRIGVIVDDKPSVIGSPDFRWFKAKRGEGHIRVQVWEADPDAA